MEVTIKVKDNQGNLVEVVKEFLGESLISHDFSKMEGLVEKIRTEMLKEVSCKILKKNQRAYIEDCKKKK